MVYIIMILIIIIITCMSFIYAMSCTYRCLYIQCICRCVYIYMYNGIFFAMIYMHEYMCIHTHTHTGGSYRKRFEVGSVALLSASLTLMPRARYYIYIYCIYTYIYCVYIYVCI